MLNTFNTYCQQNKLFKPNDSILLTVSGGIDSVVMCELFKQSNVPFAIAHCNFQLRGKESTEDESFVEMLAEKYAVPFHSISFDTKKHAKKHKLSTQLAARELRYSWFEEIRTQYQYKYIATAHHQDDSIETFFINLLRGTGIKGLHGILPSQGKIIRPLLCTNKKSILAFAKKQKLNYREDSSNRSDKYTRNKIRHTLIPLLNNINKSANANILTSIENLKYAEALYIKEIEKKTINLIKKEGRVQQISISGLKKLKPMEPYLFELLHPLGFNSSVIHEIINAIDAESGKQFYSDTHRLIKDRNCLLIEDIKQSNKLNDLQKVLKNSSNVFFNNKQLTFKIIKHDSKTLLNQAPSVAQFDYDKIVFPLIIRKWKQGDSFQPIGMKGKKKLSDYFIDKKISLLEKENCYVLESNGNIIWVIGYRMDDNYKITNSTKNIYFVELVK